MTTSIHIALTLILDSKESRDATVKNLNRVFTSCHIEGDHPTQLNASIYESTNTSFLNGDIVEWVKKEIVGEVEEGYIDIYDHCHTEVWADE